VCTKWQRFNGQLPGVVLFAPISFHHPSRLSPQHSCPSNAIALPTHQQPQYITLRSGGPKGNLAVIQLSPPTTDCCDEYDRYVLLTRRIAIGHAGGAGVGCQTRRLIRRGRVILKLERVTIRSLSAVWQRLPYRLDHDRPYRHRSKPPSSLLWFAWWSWSFRACGPAVPRNLQFPPCRAGKLSWRWRKYQPRRPVIFGNKPDTQQKPLF
jgi:hypothetical protein